jgi:hypothetical protein
MTSARVTEIFHQSRFLLVPLVYGFMCVFIMIVILRMCGKKIAEAQKSAASKKTVEMEKRLLWSLNVQVGGALILYQ